MTIEVTPREYQILVDSMSDRIQKEFDRSEAYRKGGSLTMQKDCLDEMREVKALYEKFRSMAR